MQNNVIIFVLMNFYDYLIINRCNSINQSVIGWLLDPSVLFTSTIEFVLELCLLYTVLYVQIFMYLKK